MFLLLLISIVIDRQSALVMTLVFLHCMMCLIRMTLANVIPTSQRQPRDQHHSLHLQLYQATQPEMRESNLSDLILIWKSYDNNNNNNNLDQ